MTRTIATLVQYRTGCSNFLSPTNKQLLHAIAYLLLVLCTARCAYYIRNWVLVVVWVVQFQRVPEFL